MAYLKFFMFCYYALLLGRTKVDSYKDFFDQISKTLSLVSAQKCSKLRRLKASQHTVATSVALLNFIF